MNTKEDIKKFLAALPGELTWTDGEMSKISPNSSTKEHPGCDSYDSEALAELRLAWDIFQRRLDSAVATLYQADQQPRMAQDVQ